MEPFKSILVDIDATASAHPALDQAVLLAKRSGAKLTVADTVTFPDHDTHHSLLAGAEDPVALERRLLLARIARQLRDVQATAELLVGRPATALIQEVLRAKHDLVLRSHARDVAKSGATGFGTVDFELLRKCPCPLFLVRQGPPAVRPRIACAVHTSSEDPSAQALNTKIVESGLLLASYLNAHQPTLLHVWAAPAERAIRHQSADDQFSAYLKNTQRDAAAMLARLAESFAGQFDERTTVLRRGEPQQVLPEYVVSEGIDVLVMGTVARGGISGMLIGNTAERVLRRLSCSVVTVKPDGFVSPVRLEDR